MAAAVVALMVCALSVDDRYLLVSYIPQQLGSATSAGLMHWLRNAAVLNRTAVLPRVRAAEPSYRTVVGVNRAEPYFDAKEFWDVSDLQEGWPCVPLIETSDWAKRLTKRPLQRPVVDVLLFVGGPATPTNPVQSCYPDLLRRLNAVKGPGAFSWIGPTKLRKAAELLAGRVIVKAIKCASTAATASKVLTALSGSRSVMIATPDVDFLKHPWTKLCKTGVRHRWPDLASQWRSYAKRLVVRRWGTGVYGCVHLRVEKLFRFLRKKVRTGWTMKNGSATLPELDQCIENAGVVVEAVKKAVGRRLWVTHDMSPTFGSATEHVDDVDRAGYIRWRKSAAERLSGLGSGFCESAEHREVTYGHMNKTVGRTGRHSSRTFALLQANVRSCALADAAVCKASNLTVRFGAGSWSEFVGGTQLRECGEIEDAANRCRKGVKRCWEIPTLRR
eukprot:Hpha_TRINITY_DN19281_c0_g1::TRINITY_DN19281_c0_g1_i1::g.194252::m.194252